MATEPTLMKLRLQQINKIVSKFDRFPSLKGVSEIVQGKRIGESDLATEIRDVLNSMPKGYTVRDRSLKTRAKMRFVQWREMQAKGEWRNLSEEEQARWMAYAEAGTDLGTIYKKETYR